MVHVLDLLGCVALGRTTEEAIDAAPDAIVSDLDFLQRCGERSAGAKDERGAIESRVAQHIAEGKWLGNGSPYLIFASDFDPVEDQEIELFLRRFHQLRSELASWVGALSPAELDAEAGERPARAVLLHVLAPPGGMLSAALDGVSGFSRIERLAERGELPIDEALLQVEQLAAARIRETTAEERRRVVQRANDQRTLRKAIRRILEHDWEHLAALGRRPGGPTL
jgi:hypothetical protein